MYDRARVEEPVERGRELRQLVVGRTEGEALVEVALAGIDLPPDDYPFYVTIGAGLYWVFTSFGFVISVNAVVPS